jgi:hypothetical protein
MPKSIPVSSRRRARSDPICLGDWCAVLPIMNSPVQLLNGIDGQHLKQQSTQLFNRIRLSNTLYDIGSQGKRRDKPVWNRE